MAEIKRTDVDSLNRKLGEFAKDLPEQERHVLGWLMDRAQASSELSEGQLEGVAGGGSRGEGDLAEALGFGPTTNSITVSWSKSFAN